MSLRTKIPLVVMFLSILLYFNQDPTVTRADGTSKHPQEPLKSVDQLLNESARDLSRIHAHVEEWGTLNISQPLLMYDCGEFSLDSLSDPWISAQQYVNKAQTETNGGIAQLAQTILATRLYAELAPAGTSNATSVTNAAALPGATNAPDTSFPSSYLSLLGSTTNYTIPTSTALTIGMSDKLKEIALRMMAAPDHRLIAPNVKLYVALVQVSINPGKRTQQHYIADVSADFEYEYYSSTPDADGHKLVASREVTGTQPMVLDVMPLLDAQSLDMKNSEQQAFSLVAALLGTMPSSAVNGQLGAVMSYMEKHERDSATATAVPVINSYTTSTGFGFRVAPSYQAITDPDDQDSASGNVLAPTTFPAIVFLYIDPTELEYPLKNQPKTDDVDDPKDLATSETASSASGKKKPKPKVGLYNKILTHITGHWYRRDDTWWFPRQEEDAEETLEQDRLVGDLNETVSHLYKDFASGSLTDQQDYEFLQVRRDRYKFEPSDIGLTQGSPLPEDLLEKINSPDASMTNSPVVEGIEPNYIDPTKGGYFVITGQNLGAATTSQVIVGNTLAVAAQDVRTAYNSERTNQDTATADAAARAAEGYETNALAYARYSYTNASYAYTNALAAGTGSHTPSATAPSAIPVLSSPTNAASASTNSNFPVYVPGIPVNTNAFTNLATNSCLIVYVPKSPAGYPMPVNKMESPQIPVTVVTSNGVARSALHLIPVAAAPASTNADNAKPPATNAASSVTPATAAAIATSGGGFSIVTSPPATNATTSPAPAAAPAAAPAQ